MDKLSTLARAAGLLAIATTPAAAQGVVLDWPIGSDATAVGDVDADGVGDYALGDASAGGNAGAVVFVSGVDGAERFRVAGAAVGDRLGSVVVGTGDLDGDGVGDAVALGLPAGGSFARAISGAGGATLWQVGAQAPGAQLGARLARAGDVDQDGVADVLVDFGPAGQATDGALVLSGADGSVLRVLAPAGLASPAVRGLAGLDDLDGDGAPELAVGYGDGPAAGAVLVHDGQSGAVVHSIPAPAGELQFGQALARADDVNGDGTPDLTVGSPSGLFDATPFTSRVRILSGADGSILRTISPSTPQEQNLRAFGKAVAAIDDLDGDGVGDVALSAGSYRVGCCAVATAEMRVYSSATGALLYLGPGQAELHEVVPDANGDGVSDYLVAWSGGEDGSFRDALALLGWTAPFEACPAQKPTSAGCLPQVRATGTPSLTLGDDLTLRVDGAVPGQPGVFVWSRDLAALPFRGGLLCLAAPRFRLPPATTTGPTGTCSSTGQPSGSMRLGFSKADLAALGLLPGDAFLVQGFFRDGGYPPPLDLGMSGALVVTIWP